MENLYGKVFAKSLNGSKVLILNTNRECLRLRQRNKDINGMKNTPMRFVSYKEMLKQSKKNKVLVIDNVKFYNKSKL
jgi:hypothetical protein